MQSLRVIQAEQNNVFVVTIGPLLKNGAGILAYTLDASFREQFRKESEDHLVLSNVPVASNRLFGTHEKKATYF